MKTKTKHEFRNAFKRKKILLENQRPNMNFIKKVISE